MSNSGFLDFYKMLDFFNQKLDFCLCLSSLAMFVDYFLRRERYWSSH